MKPIFLFFYRMMMLRHADFSISKSADGKNFTLTLLVNGKVKAIKKIGFVGESQLEAEKNTMLKEVFG